MLRFFFLTAVIAAANALLATPVGAKTQAETKALIYKQQVRYYHADGVIKSIGHVAYRTIYSSNPQKRHKWKGALRWLIGVRADAQAKINALRAPPLPPHYAQWLCIHKYEGSWTDSGDPYWGGLQFGSSEWRTYGGQYAPTANLASPVEQMWAAEAYWKVSGFYPWPRTARVCGLIQ